MNLAKHSWALGLLSVLAGACSSQAPAADDTQATDEEIKSGVYSCKKDSDCVAISKGGCCPNGWNVAVNKNHVKAYEASHACHQHTICPLYVILDTRVAECDVSNDKCVMVAPEDIRCGGFTTNPHECPKGWDCQYGHVPDVPGKCVEQN